MGLTLIVFVWLIHVATFPLTVSKLMQSMIKIKEVDK